VDLAQVTAVISITPSAGSYSPHPKRGVLQRRIMKEIMNREGVQYAVFRLLASLVQGALDRDPQPRGPSTMTLDAVDIVETSLIREAGS
jgi:hypothetical protein